MLTLVTLLIIIATLVGFLWAIGKLPKFPSRPQLVKPDEVKLCKDCIYWLWFSQYQVPICSNPKLGYVKRLDPVNGHTEDINRTTLYQLRREPNLCGSEGRFFVHRKTAFEQFKERLIKSVPRHMTSLDVAD